MMSKHQLLIKFINFQFDRYFNTAIFIFLIGITTFPLIVLTSYGNYQELSATYIYFTVIAAILLVAAFVLPIALFNFSNAKSSSDVYFSLPIKRQDIFLQNYFLGLVITLVPIILSTICGILALALKGSPYYLTNLMMFVRIIFVYLVLYNLVILVIQKCNNLIDSFIASFIIVNIPIVLYYAIIVFLENTVLGFPYYSNYNLITLISPIYSIFMIWQVPPFTLYYPIYWLLLIILPILASMFFYLKKPEQSADASTSILIYPFIKYVCTFAIFIMCIVISYRYNFGPIGIYVFALGTSLLTYLLIQILSTRGFKPFYRSILRFAIFSIITISIVLSCQWTGMYGFAYYLPNPINVLSVDINKQFFIQAFEDVNYISLDNQPIITEDPLIIQEMIKLHQLIISNPQDTVTNTTLNINYHQGLFSHKRRFTLDNGSIPYIFYQTILQKKLWLPNYQYFYENPSIDWQVTQIADPLNTNHQLLNISLASSNQLTQALTNDLNNLSAMDIYQTNQPVSCFISLIQTTNNQNYTIPIYSTFKEVLNFLAQSDIAIPKIINTNIKEMTIIAETSYYFFNAHLFNEIYLAFSQRLTIPTSQWPNVINNLTYTSFSDQRKKIVLIQYTNDSYATFHLLED